MTSLKDSSSPAGMRSTTSLWRSTPWSNITVTSTSVTSQGSVLNTLPETTISPVSVFIPSESATYTDSPNSCPCALPARSNRASSNMVRNSGFPLLILTSLGEGRHAFPTIISSKPADNPGAPRNCRARVIGVCSGASSKLSRAAVSTALRMPPSSLASTWYAD